MALGEVADGFGDFVQGACVASLSHRHDVRMGIASAVLLRERIASSAALRLEVLCVVHLCYYWKWPAAGFLRSVLRRPEELLGADARGRASLYERAWAEAAAALPAADFSVVCRRDRRTVELWPRAQMRAIDLGTEGQLVYSLEGPPSKCRRGGAELAALTEEMRSGSLEDALAKVAQAFAAPGATYSACDAHLRTVRLWKNAACARLDLLCWLFKAEGVAPAMCAEDWALLAGTRRSGAKKGVAAAGDLTYDGAVAACEAVSKHVWAASGATYGLGDLACFLRLSQSSEAAWSKVLPPPPTPIDVASDLGDMSSCAQVPPRRSLLLKTVHGGESREPPAAGTGAGSGGAAASGARPLARRAVWRAGALKTKIHAANVPRVPVQWVQVLARGAPGIAETIMDHLPLRDQVALSRTSRTQQGRCLAVARRWGPARWNSVRSLVARALQADQPFWEERIAASSVRLGNLLRAYGCALDYLEGLQAAGPLPADAPPLAMALVRLALRYELRGRGEKMLRDDFVAGGRLHVPGVGEAETLLTEAAAARRQ